MEFIKNKRGLRLIITFILLIMVSRISIIDKMNWVGQVLFGCYIKYKEVITIASRDGYFSAIYCYYINGNAWRKKVYYIP